MQRQKSPTPPPRLVHRDTTTYGVLVGRETIALTPVERYATVTPHIDTPNKYKKPKSGSDKNTIEYWTQKTPATLVTLREIHTSPSRYSHPPQPQKQNRIGFFLINRGIGTDPTYKSCIRMERFAKPCVRDDIQGSRNFGISGLSKGPWTWGTGGSSLKLSK